MGERAKERLPFSNIMGDARSSPYSDRVPGGTNRHPRHLKASSIVVEPEIRSPGLMAAMLGETVPRVETHKP